MVQNASLRSLIAQSAYKAGGGHIPSCYSCIDIINELFNEFKIDENNNNFLFSAKVMLL